MKVATGLLKTCRESLYCEHLIFFRLPVANIATSVFMCGTSGTTAYTIDVLIALAAVLRKIYAGAKHSANICVSLIKAFLNDSIDKWTAMEQHSLVRL